ncbi:MAG: helicase-related protein, partial [bacterium]
GVINPWTDSDSIITSHAWAAYSEDRRKEIASVDWDVVVVDEAHHARIHRSGASYTRTNLFRLVEALVTDRAFSRRGALFITATPLQLELYELYSLVDMLNPTLFSSQPDFEKHIRDRAGLNQLVERLRTGGIPREESARQKIAADLVRYLEVSEREAIELLDSQGPEELQQGLRARHKLSEVMIRNRKADTIGFQPRTAFRWDVELSPMERHVHELMQKVLDEGWRLQERTGQHTIGFLMVILQKLLASSSRALLTSLRKRRSRLAGPNIPPNPDEIEEELEEDNEASTLLVDVAPDLEGKIKQIDQVIAVLEQIEVDSKALVLLERLGVLFNEEPDAKVLIFAEFRETQDMLVELISQQWSVHKFHGQLVPEQKDAAVSRFRQGRGPQILVSTEAGGEGRNFQFCHHLVNYDLPWNPMRVEQRIGRLDRIGQEHPITIFNFHVRETIEGRILEVLERRIRIFEQAVGGLDPILGEAEADIRKALKLASEARDAEIERIGERLEHQIQRAKRAEGELRDLIMQAKSFSAEIAQLIRRSRSPISQEDFEAFLIELLTSSGAHVSPPNADGERRVVFHLPFTLEHPELFGGQEARRVCFDPRTNVDSEYVEYFGFGHPIVDALVRRATQERQDGSAAVRRVLGSEVGLDGPGWQFNWIVKIGGLRPKEYLYGIFVDDEGQVDEEVGERLIRQSRKFGNEASSAIPGIELLDDAYERAVARVGVRKDGDLAEAQGDAADRATIEEKRADALFDHKKRAAEDRIDSCRRTLERLKASTDRQVLQAVPLWEANLTRAEAELEAIEDDRRRALADINQKRNPSAEFRLLNVARIEAV